VRPTDQHLAIFAGAGELPLIAVRNARAQQIPFTVYHITEADLHAELASDKDVVIRQVSLGTVAQTFAHLKADKITHTILLGKVEKQRLLQDVRRDAAAEAIYAAAADRRDDTLFHEFARALAAMQIEILPQKALLDGCFLPVGELTQKKPISASLIEDIEFGYSLSKKIGSLDIGQTAVVFQKMVLAVEAIEGTDAAIRRAGDIIRGYASTGSLTDAHRAQSEPDASLRTRSLTDAHRAQSEPDASLRTGGVVCKTAKTSQDPRFDLPAVGMRTLDTMRDNGMQALVIEAEHTLVVRPAEFIDHANRHGLIVIGR
jgi:DUF1009 family protein